MKFPGFLLACLLPTVINGFMESDRKCGEKLNEIMWIVCENGFNTLMAKRSGDLHANLPTIGDSVPYPYASSSLANIFQMEAQNLLAKTRRMRMAGIADECCTKSCTLNELSAYCK